jgi:hypothetical protein
LWHGGGVGLWHGGVGLGHGGVGLGLGGLTTGGTTTGGTTGGGVTVGGETTTGGTTTGGTITGGTTTGGTTTGGTTTGGTTTGGTTTGRMTSIVTGLGLIGVTGTVGLEDGTVVTADVVAVADPVDGDGVSAAALGLTDGAAAPGGAEVCCLGTTMSGLPPD